MKTLHRCNDGKARAARRAEVFLRRFAGDARGAIAIEFAMLAIPFSLLTFAILESSISFGGQQMLTNAADNVARKVRTGQLRPDDLTERKLSELICADIQLVVAAGCPGLVVDLRSYQTFADAAAQRITFTEEKDLDDTGFDVKPGRSMTKNQLRVFYRWPVMTDFLRASMSNLKGGYTLHYASVTWQNEPFED